MSLLRYRSTFRGKAKGPASTLFTREAGPFSSAVTVGFELSLHRRSGAKTAESRHFPWCQHTVSNAVFGSDVAKMLPRTGRPARPANMLGTRGQAKAWLSAGRAAEGCSGIDELELKGATAPGTHLSPGSAAQQCVKPILSGVQGFASRFLVPTNADPTFFLPLDFCFVPGDGPGADHFVGGPFDDDVKLGRLAVIFPRLWRIDHSNPRFRIMELEL